MPAYDGSLMSRRVMLTGAKPTVSLLRSLLCPLRWTQRNGAIPAAPAVACGIAGLIEASYLDRVKRRSHRRR
jgi:hypothetical protein